MQACAWPLLWHAFGDFNMASNNFNAVADKSIHASLVPPFFDRKFVMETNGIRGVQKIRAVPIKSFFPFRVESSPLIITSAYCGQTSVRILRAICLISTVEIAF